MSRNKWIVSSKEKLKNKAVEFLKHLLRKLDKDSSYYLRKRIPRYPEVEESSVSKIHFEHKFSNHGSFDHSIVLEEIKRQVMHSIDQHFFYYFPVIHYSNEMPRTEEFRVTLFYKKNHEPVCHIQ